MSFLYEGVDLEAGFPEDLLRAALANAWNNLGLRYALALLHWQALHDSRQAINAKDLTEALANSKLADAVEALALQLKESDEIIKKPKQE